MANEKQRSFVFRSISAIFAGSAYKKTINNENGDLEKLSLALAKQIAAYHMAEDEKDEAQIVNNILLIAGGRHPVYNEGMLREIQQRVEKVLTAQYQEELTNGFDEKTIWENINKSWLSDHFWNDSYGSDILSDCIESKMQRKNAEKSAEPEEIPEAEEKAAPEQMKKASGQQARTPEEKLRQEISACLVQWKASVLKADAAGSLELMYRLTAMTLLLDSKRDLTGLNLDQTIDRMVTSCKNDYMKESFLRETENELKFQYSIPSTDSRAVDRTLANGIKKLVANFNATDRFRAECNHNHKPLLGKDYLQQEKTVLTLLNSQPGADRYENYLNLCLADSVMQNTKENNRILTNQAVKNNADSWMTELKNVDPAWLKSSQPFKNLRRTLEQFQAESLRVFADSQQNAGFENIVKISGYYDKLIEQANAYLVYINDPVNQHGTEREDRRRRAVEKLLENFQGAKMTLDRCASYAALNKCQVEKLSAKSQPLKAEIKREYHNNVKILALLQEKTVLTDNEKKIARESMKNLLACDVAEHLMEKKASGASKENDALYDQAFVSGENGIHFNLDGARQAAGNALKGFDTVDKDVSSMIRDAILRKGQLPEALEKIKNGPENLRQKNGITLK